MLLGGASDLLPMSHRRRGLRLVVSHILRGGNVQLAHLGCLSVRRSAFGVRRLAF
jgi:hypothetical protein